MSNYTWVPFYTELADAISHYQTDRTTLVNMVQRIYTMANVKMPKLDSTDVPKDMDPFTVFGIFNKTIKASNRIALCKELKELFRLNSSVPSDFDGIPVLNPLNATFYRFTGEPERGEQDVDALWNCFEAALQYADQSDEASREAFIRAYDAAKDLKGNRWKLTMGLYWARPHTYLSLDSRNRWFLTTEGILDGRFAERIKGLKEVPDGAEYLNICHECVRHILSGTSYTSIVDYSYHAWLISEKVNQEQKQFKSEQVSAAGAALADQDVRPVHYWLYAPGENAAKWDAFYDAGVMGIGWSKLGNLLQYPSREAIAVQMKELYGDGTSYKNSALANWQFAHEIMPGDVVFAKKGRDQIIGCGKVKTPYIFSEEMDGGDYVSFREVQWTHKGCWSPVGFKMPSKTLTDLTLYTEYVENLQTMISADEEDEMEAEEKEAPLIAYPPYSKENFLSEVYMSETDYDTLTGLLRKKKNMILQGAPGVGKTFVAKRLAYAMMGLKDQERVAMVQFHQSYSYEDFIMGFRPDASGFELRKGVFYNFCKKAQDDIENDYFFIIDEINRGNLSKIFGELFMLIENDKRDIPIQLLYSDEKFFVPHNVMIIGMMNTADRSLAMMDYALRRRFAFFDMTPGFDSEGFRTYQQSIGNRRFDHLIDCVKNLNRAIAEDESLGEGFRIGHSYFSHFSEASVDDSALTDIIRFELVPLLKEYWFDEPQKVKDWTARLESAVK